MLNITNIVLEQKVTEAFLLKFKELGPDEKTVTFTKDELENICGGEKIEMQSLKEAIDKLAFRTFKKEEDGTTVVFTLVSGTKYINIGSESFKVELDLNPHI